MNARVALVALAVAAVAFGCAAVIDLGDEARLRTIDAGTPTLDAGAPDTGPPVNVNVCGLPDSANATCAACIHQSCCDISKTCANEPDCLAGLQCVKDCLVEVDCIGKCRENHPSVTAVTDCSAFQCQLCTPGTECAKLGACVFALPNDALIRQVEEGRILALDENQCKQARQQVAGQQSDAGACYGD